MQRFFVIVCFILMSLNVLSCKTGGNPHTIEFMKYPVILVHGIFAHDRGGIINFWGRIPKVFSDNGIKVFLGNTDAWGSYESNAEILKVTVDRVLEETNSEKVNIIAHSKGGIDSRYFIWKYDYGDKVASLTTIATPHHGAEIADLVYAQDIVHTKFAKNVLELYGKLYGDVNPDLYTLNQQLTTEHMRDFNETIFADARVFYQSMYVTMRNPFDDLQYFDSYRYIKKISGENDGIVSVISASWGDNVRKIGNGISHAEIIDYKKRNISGINIPEIYMQIANELSEMGF